MLASLMRQARDGSDPGDIKATLYVGQDFTLADAVLLQSIIKCHIIRQEDQRIQI